MPIGYAVILFAVAFKIILIDLRQMVEEVNKDYLSCKAVKTK